MTFHKLVIRFMVPAAVLLIVAVPMVVDADTHNGTSTDDDTSTSTDSDNATSSDSDSATSTDDEGDDDEESIDEIIERLKAQIEALIVKINELREEAGVEEFKNRGRCVSFVNHLSQGKHGDSVEKLQQFLKDEGYYDYPEITGYYGPVTEKAVQKFQKAKGIVMRGNPHTTGYGVVGPRTRNAIRKLTCKNVKNTIGGDEEDEDDDDENATSTDDGTDEEEDEEEDDDDDDDNATSTDDTTDDDDDDDDSDTGTTTDDTTS